MSAQEEPVRRRALIILEDNIDTGNLDVDGIVQPEQHDPKSPAHIVAKFIADNMDELVLAAATGGQRVTSPDVGEPIIGPDREHTIVLP